MAREKTNSWADSIVGRLALWLVFPTLVFFLWGLGIKSGSAVVPKFRDVFAVLANPFEPPSDIYSRSLAFSFLMTLIRLLMGFGLGVVTAVPLGIWAGRSRVVDRLLEPAVQTARFINPIVLLPMATVLFGVSSIATLIFGGTEAWRYDISDQIQIAMLFILWWGAFFPVFVSTSYGVRSVRVSYIETMRLLGASKAQLYKKVIIPHCLPHMLNGMRIALGVTWLVLIAAELFPGTRSGLGYMLCTACKTSDYQYTFAAMAVIGMTGFFMDTLLRKAEDTVGHWQARQR